MTVTTDTYTIIGVGVALAGMILVSSHQQSQEVSELRQLDGLRGRPFVDGGGKTDTSG